MRKPLTIAVAQPACVPYDFAANAFTHAAMVRRSGARIVASFAGSTGEYVMAAGRSAIWSPDGTLVAEAGPQAGAVLRPTLR